MATVNGTEYGFIDLQVAAGGDITRHNFKDINGRAAIAPTENTSTASATHDAGAYFFMGGVLYMATDDIAIGDTIADGTNCTAAVLGNDLLDLKTAVDSGALSAAAGYAEDKIIKRSKNLFDGDIIPNILINQTSGEAQENSNYKSSNFIRVKPSQEYTISASDLGGLRYAIYDANKTFISGAMGQQTFLTPPNAEYIRFCLGKAYTSIQLEEGGTASSYIPYSAEIYQHLIGPESVTEENAVFFDRSKNLVDPEKTVYGYIVNQSNGEFAANVNHKRTDYVPVKPQTKYCISAYNNANISIRYAFYSKSKVYLSGGMDTLDSIHYLIESPDGAYFMVISTGVDRYPLMIAESAVKINFVKFDTVLKKSRLPIIAPENTSFFETSINLVDPNTCIAGYYVNQTSGEFSENSAHTRTDFIPIERGKTYAIARFDNADTMALRYYFYDENRVGISDSGAYVPRLTNGGLVVTAPNTACYMVASAANYAFPFMIAASGSALAYQPYYKRIKEEYLDHEEPFIANLPGMIYGLVGFETNIYFENIVEDWKQYDFNVIAYKGMQTERGYRFTPTAADVGTVRIEIEVYKNRSLIKTLVTILKIGTLSSGSAQEESVIILGDSTTDNGIAVTKLNGNVDNSQLTLHTLGTRGTSPNNHEGRSGWTFQDYFTRTLP